MYLLYWYWSGETEFQSSNWFRSRRHKGQHIGKKGRTARGTTHQAEFVEEIDPDWRVSIQNVECPFPVTDAAHSLNSFSSSPVFNWFGSFDPLIDSCFSIFELDWKIQQGYTIA